MLTKSHISRGLSCWDSLPFLVKGSIATTAATVITGLADIYITKGCDLLPEQIRNYACLKSNAFFKPQTIAAISNPLIDGVDFIYALVRPLYSFLPFSRIDIIDSRLHEELMGKLKNLPIEIRREGIGLLMKCKPYLQLDISKHMAHAFAEEFVFRLMVQKLAFIGLSKFMPNPLSGIVRNSIFRTIAATALFAFGHFKNNGENIVAPQFFGGLILGSLYENYGILASTVGHGLGNLVWDEMTLIPLCYRAHQGLKQFLKNI